MALIAVKYVSVTRRCL